MEAKKNIGIIILAAGASTRLGQPKQLLPYSGKTLLGYSVQMAVDSVADTIVVVLGAHEDQIRKTVDLRQVRTVTNPHWQEGMAATIRCGVQALMQAQPQAEAAVLMLCDQPYVTTDLLNDLITVHQNTGKAIVACQYEDTVGVPALFAKIAFPELLRLSGDVGARAIIQRHPSDVEMVTFSAGIVDIDTTEDYQRLLEAPGINH